MELGHWFLGDEFNLADPSIMTLLLPILEGRSVVEFPGISNEIRIKNGFRFFATQNDTAYANRHQLPISLRNRFLEVQVSDFDTNELVKIIIKKDQTTHSMINTGSLRPISEESSKSIANIYKTLRMKNLSVTLREIIKWIRRKKNFNIEGYHLTGYQLLSSRYANDKEVKDIFKKEYQFIHDQSFEDIKVSIKQIDNDIHLQEGTLRMVLRGCNLSNSKLFNNDKEPPECFTKSLIRLGFAALNKEPILIVGPSSYKSLLVHTWNEISKTNSSSNNFKIVHLTTDTDSSNLIGQIIPYSFLDVLKFVINLGRNLLIRIELLIKERGLSTNCEDHRFISTIREILSANYEKEKKNTLNEVLVKLKLCNNESNQTNKELGVTVQTEFDPQTQIELNNDLYDDDEDQLSDENDDYLNPATFIVKSKATETIKKSEELTSNDANHSKDDFNYQKDGNWEELIDDFDSNNQIADDFGSIYANIGSNIPKKSNREEIIDDFFTENRSNKNEIEDDFLLGSNNPNSNYEIAKDEIMQEQIVDDFPSRNLNNFVEQYQGQFLSTDDFFNDPIQLNTYSKEELELFDTLKRISDKLVSTIQSLRSSVKLEDFVVNDYHQKIDFYLKNLSKIENKNKTFFLFKDGSITESVKQGKQILLEDFNLPSQAMTERLNSLLEPDRSFTLTEDITGNLDGSGIGEIEISEDFQVFATINIESENQKINISPATRSRFTEIRVSAYTENDIKYIVEQELGKNEISNKLLSLRSFIIKDPHWNQSNDIHILFRFIDFISKETNELDIEYNILLGARFFYFERLKQVNTDQFKYFKNIASNWYKELKKMDLPEKYQKLFEKPLVEDGVCMHTDEKSNSEPFVLLENGNISLKYTGLVIKPFVKYENTKSLHKNFNLTPTATLILQMARMFCSIISGSALLLEGPPGVGKTAVINQLCKILGRPYERINFSGSTTIDQLFGSIIPQSVNGIREFKWRDGKIVKAIKERKWLLLDEVNLASSEILQTLSPLLHRKINSFTVPGSEEEIKEELKDIRIFATMNPLKIGGGRSKLPRSIENLFTIVKLEEYDSEELFMIIIDLFQNAFSKHYVNLSHIQDLYQLHLRIKGKYSRREIGHHGGPYEFNLREIAKFKDILLNNAEDQVYHFKFMVEDSDITSLSIRKFADLVYASQFHYIKDQKIVRDLISQQFVLRNSHLSESNPTITNDDSVFDMIRIGSIHLRKATTCLINTSNLIHSKETVKQLELLAAACQSKRAVLLEGETCSKKTALVQELAYLTKNKLLIISLNQDTETSDLIGQWVLDKQKSGSNHYNTKLNKFFEETIKLCLIFGFSQLLDTESLEITNQVRLAYEHKTKNDNSIKNSLIALEQLKHAINQLIKIFYSKFDSGRELISIFENCRYKIEYYSSKLLNEIKTEKINNGASFVFIDSEFVTAIRMGYWVLLDNVNSATPEVIDRINSLLEEKPTLNIYEYHDGEELSREKKTIHKDFRIFCTSNSQRESSNKLSSAFLNRVIRIWLPKIDDDVVIEDIKNHEIYELTKKLFNRLNFNNSKLSLILTQFHASFKMLIKAKKITLGEDSNLTFRKIIKTINSFDFAVKSDKTALEALMYSISDNYLQSLRLNEHKVLAIRELKSVLDKQKSKTRTMSFIPSSDDYPIDVNEIMITIEHVLVKITLNSLKYVDSTDRSFYLSNLLQFIATVLIPLNSSEKKSLDNFMITVQSDSKLNLVKELDRLVAGVKLSGIENYDLNDDNVDKTTDKIKRLKSLLLDYSKKSTLSDFKFRKQFIERIINIFERFSSILSSIVDFITMNSLKETVNKIIQSIDEISCFKTIINWYIPFESKIFYNLNKNLNETSDISAEILWAIKREFNKPIIGCERKINILITRLIDKNISSDFLLKHAMSVSWLCLLWSFNHLLPKETIFFLKSKFNLNENILNDYECIKYSISLGIKLMKPIEEYFDFCVDEEKRTIFEVIEENNTSEDSLIKQIEDKKKILTDIKEQILAETNDIRKQDLIRKPKVHKEELETIEFKLVELRDKKKVLNLNLIKATKFISHEVETIKTDSEFNELNNLSINNRIETINKMIRILDNSANGSMNIDTSLDGDSLTFSFYFGLLSPYLKKLTYMESSNDKNKILLLFLSAYFVKMKQIITKMNRFRLILIKMDENINIQALLNDSDALLLVLYDEKNLSNEFSLMLIDKQAKAGRMQLFYYISSQDTEKLGKLIGNFIKKNENDFNVEMKRIYIHDSNSENENIFSVSSIIRQVLSNQLNFEECKTISADKFDEGLMTLVQDLLKLFKNNLNKTDYSDSFSFLNIYEKILATTQEVMLNQEFDEYDKIQGIYKILSYERSQLSLMKTSLEAKAKAIYNKFIFDSISECRAALSLIGAFEKDLRFVNNKLLSSLKLKLQESLDKSLNTKQIYLLNEFIAKMQTLFALMATHFIQNDELNDLFNYEYNCKLIVELNKFMRDITNCFHFTYSNNKLTVCCEHPKEYFQDMQFKFDDLSKLLKVPANYLDDIKFKNFFEDIGNQIECVKKYEDYATCEMKFYRDNSQMKRDLNNLLKVLSNKLNEVNQFDPTPQELISHLKKLLIKIEEVNEDAIEQELLNDLNSETRILLNDVDEYKKRIKSVDFFYTNELIKGQLKYKYANISEIYKKADAPKFQANPIEILDPEVLIVDKKEKWTYEKLVESESLKKFISSIVKQLKEKIELNFKKYDQYEYEWCIMVDNSGSMSSKEIFVAETLVVLIEVLRRLEHKFAVARFGNKNDKRALIKDFKTPMSLSLGQQILESFTYDQGTYPVEALQNVSSKIWPDKEKKAADQQRIVLMITDGLMTQKDSEPFIDLKWQKSFKLGIVVLKEKNQDFFSEGLLKEITEKRSSNESCYRVLNLEDSNKLVFELLYVMVYIFDEIMKTSPSLAQSMKQSIGSNLLNRIEVPSKPSDSAVNSFEEHIKCLLENVGKLDYEYAVKKGHSKPNLMFKVNYDNNTFKDIKNSPEEIGEEKLDLKKKSEELENYYSSSFTDEIMRTKLTKLEELWNEIESKLFKQISDYTDVFQTTVFPLNKYTRKKANTKGSNLYFPGLVKAVITDFNYKKIFCTKNAGGIKVYSIVLAIDISYSMNGHMADCAVDVLISFISSLQKIGIENFSIILFGKNVKLIKLENQSWDSRVMYALIDNLRFNWNYMTNDAAAIETAISILENSTGNGLKKIFCFTDGFSSCRSKLLKALKKADSLNIETIGVAVGFEKPFVQNSYKIYIHVALPFAFHKALQALYEKSEEGIDFKDSEILHESSIEDVNRILEGFDSSRVFDFYLKSLKFEREVKLVKGNSQSQDFTVDICFVVDCTGSMTPWLEEAKNQMKSIVKKIKVEIHEIYPSINFVFNIGVLGFRDFSDGPKQYEELIFTDNVTRFENFLDKLSAFGGDDIPEDVVG